MNWLYQKYHLCREQVSTTLKRWSLVALPLSPCCCFVGAGISQGTMQTSESCCLQTVWGTASGLSQTSFSWITSPDDPDSTEKKKEEGKGHHRFTQQAVGHSCLLCLVHLGSATPEPGSWQVFLLLQCTQQLSQLFLILWGQTNTTITLLVVPFKAHAFWRPYPVPSQHLSMSVTDPYLALYILTVQLS